MRLAALLLLAVFSSAAHAELHALRTGNDLLYNIQQSKNGDDFSLFYVSGYLRGVTDSLVLIGSLCPTDGVDMSQYTDIVEKYLVKNPETRNDNPLILTMLAVGQAFPCKNKHLK